MALTQCNNNNPNFEGIDKKWELYMTKQKLHKNPLTGPFPKIPPEGIQIIAFTSNALKTTATTFQFLQVYFCFPTSQENNNT